MRSHLLGSWSAARRLLALDLKLGWRDFRSSFRLLDNRALVALMGLLALVMHAAAWSIGTRLLRNDAGGPASHADVVAELSPGVVFVLLLMTAQTLNSLTKVLYGRGDLELLLSSPFSPRIVLCVRVLAVSLGAAASAAIFVVPVADVGLLQGRWASLALLPVLAGGALLASALSLCLMMGLIALLGPRRTRLAGQIVATFLGGGFMVWLQVRRFMPADILPAWRLAGNGGLHAAFGAALRLPVRAAAGEAGALALWLTLSVAIYAAATLGFGRRFAGQAVAVLSVPPAVQTRSRGGRDRRFRTRLGTSLRQKEWRLIRRDPWLLSQLLLQVLYMSPMMAMLWNGPGTGGSLVLALSPMIVVVSYQVAASMTWLSLSGEDAPELLATAPVSRRALNLGKLAAVAELTLMLAAAPLVWLATISLRAAACTAALSGVAVTLAMLLSLWRTKPAKRSAFAARHRESKLLALMEMVMSMLMGVTGALLVVESWWALAPLGLALLILLANRPRTAPVWPAPRRPPPEGGSADADGAAGGEARQQTA